MSRLAATALAALAVLSTASCQLARDLDSTRQWLVYTEAAHAARLQAHYQDAERLYRAALREAEQPTRQSRLVASSMDSLGTLYLDQKRNEEAEKSFEGALTIASDTLDANDPDLSVYLEDLASCYALEGKFQKAEPLLQRCLAIWSVLPKADREKDLARCRIKLANVYYHENKLTEAEPLYKEGMPVMEKTGLLNKSLVAQSKQNYEDTRRQLARKSPPSDDLREKDR